MSRTFHFHQSEDINQEFLKRRLRRKNKHRLHTQSRSLKENYLDAKLAIQKIQELVHRSLEFIAQNEQWFDQILDGSMKIVCNEEEDHPIFSRHTRLKVESLVVHNPELTNLYFERGNDVTLRIGYTPPHLIGTSRKGEMNPINSETTYSSDSMDSPFGIELMNFINTYCQAIKSEIVRVSTKIQIAVGFPISGLDLEE